jgi:hypothetical protein
LRLENGETMRRARRGQSERPFASRRASSISSPAVRPAGPMPRATSASAAAPCRWTAATSAFAASIPCAASAPAMPVSTSPMPALAMPGLPDALTHQRPSGDAITVPLPFSATHALNRAATRFAAAIRSDCTSATVASRSRAHSAGCGVSIVATFRD